MSKVVDMTDSLNNLKNLENWFKGFNPKVCLYKQICNEYYHVLFKCIDRDEILGIFKVNSNVIDRIVKKYGLTESTFEEDYKLSEEWFKE